MSEQETEMDKMTDLYVRQLQEIGYSEEDANEFGKILHASVERFSEMFGISPEEYLEKRFAGFSGMTQSQFRQKFDTFFKYKALETENLHGREYLRDDFTHKSDDATANVIKLPESSIPDIKIRDMGKWIIKMLAMQGGSVTIISTGETVDFTAKYVNASLKRSSPTRTGAKEHNEAYNALRELIKHAEYWKSEREDQRHDGQGDLDTYTSALFMNGKLYSVIIKMVVITNEIKDIHRKFNNPVGDARYKDHSLKEIEIAPALSQTTRFYDHLQGIPDAISKVSLGILRGRVKSSLIEKDILYNKTKSGKIRGAMKTLLDGRRMIALFENHDVSTILHEMAHFWLEELRDAQSYSSCPDWSRKLWQNLEDAYGFDMETVNNAEWVKIQEHFAFEFEDYCMEGIAPTPELRPAFNKFCEWLSEIYIHVLEFVGHNQIRAASRQVFDAILGGETDELEDSDYTSFTP